MWLGAALTGWPPSIAAVGNSITQPHQIAVHAPHRTRRRVNCSWLAHVDGYGLGHALRTQLAATSSRDTGSLSPQPIEVVDDVDVSWQTLEQARDELPNISTPQGTLQALKRVQQLSASSLHQPTQPAYLADILPQLSYLLLQNSERLRPRDLVKAVTILGSFRGCDAGVLMKLCEGLKGHLAAATPSSLVALLTVLVNLGLRPGDTLLAEMLHCMEGGLATLPALQLVQLVRSLVRLGMRPATTWLYAWEDASRAELQGMSCQELSQVIWSLSEISFTPGAAWMAGFLGVCHIRLPQATGQQLAEVVAGLARLGAAPLVSPAWKAQVLQVSAALMPQLAASELVRLLTGAVSLQLHPDADWVCAAAARGREVMSNCNPRDLLDLLNSLIQLQPPSPSTVTAATVTSGTVPAAAATHQQHQVTTQHSDDTPAASNHPFGPRLTKATGASHVSSSPSPPPAHSSNTSISLEINPVPEHAASPASTASHGKPRVASSRQTDAAPAWCSVAWRRAYLQAAAACMPRFTAPGLVQLLRDVMAIDARPDSAWVSTYATLLIDKITVLGAAELSSLPHAMSKLWSSKHVMKAQLAAQLLSSSTSKLGLMTGPQLLDLAQGLCSLGVRVDQSWRQAFLHQSRRHLTELSYAQLACLPYLAIKLELQPGQAWWTALYASMQAAHHDVKSLDVPTLSNLLWGVTMSNVTPPQGWLEGVMQEARRKVEQGKAQGQVALPWRGASQQQETGVGGRAPHRGRRRTRAVSHAKASGQVAQVTVEPVLHSHSGQRHDLVDRLAGSGQALDHTSVN